MKHISLNVSEEIKHILPDTLEKDLMENEAICPVCNGLGIKVRNNPYGIKGDTSEATKKSMFPYKHQSLILCPNCYNGVVQLCKYCGKQIPRGYIDKCNCEQYKAKKNEEKRIKYQETISKAKEVDPKDIGLDTWLYDERTDDYFSDIDYFVDTYKDNEDFADDKAMLDNLPEVLWLCNKVDISMNANSIVEDACEELHEDAWDDISSQDRNELQEFLDNWCKKQTGTTTLYPNYKKYVRVRKEWFD